MTSTSDRGTVSLYVVLLAPVFLLLAGLIVDGGNAIHGRQRAFDIAEQAARAGANDIDQAELRRTGKVLVAAEACVPARDLAQQYGGKELEGVDCSPTAGRDGVTVVVRVHVRTQLIDLVPGRGGITMTGKATAHPTEGN